jgi:hypothetical protein
MRTALAISLALLVAGPLAYAGDQTAEEKAATKTIEKELGKLAKSAAKGKDYAAAVAELELGLVALPDSKKLSKELAKAKKKHEKNAAKKKPAEPKPEFAAELGALRAAAHLAVSKALAEAAVSCETEHPKRYTRYRELMQVHFPSQEALDILDLAYFAPYFSWVSQSQLKALEAGKEEVDGKWLDADAVKALDARHSNWSDPWVIDDGVHEVRTTVSLRQAKQILAYVTSYRKYFLARFKGWDLRPAKGKLPIIVTRTQAELKERMAEVAKKLGGAAPDMGGQGIQGAAYYLQTNSSLNPCFVTYEPTDATGATFKVTKFDQLQIPLVHEVTHQLAFEYVKYDYDMTRGIEHHFWAVEAIANYMGYHVYDGKAWTLTHPRTIPMGGGYLEGPFAHCKTNKNSLPALQIFMGLTRQQFLTVNNYHIAATLAYFLLEGEGGKYKDRFVDFLEVIHKVRDEPDSFTKAFPGVDFDALQAEFLRFVEQIQLDD